DGRLVDDREHLLGRCLRRRQESCAQPRDGDDGLAHRRELTVRHGRHSRLGSMESAFPTSQPADKAALRAQIRTRRTARTAEADPSPAQAALSSRVRAVVEAAAPTAVVAYAALP